MEIQTTFKELHAKLEHLNISPETPVRLIIEGEKNGSEKVKTRTRKEPYLPFLDSGMWNYDIPEDLSSNVDYYLFS